MTESNPEPCPRELADADLEVPEDGLTGEAKRRRRPRSTSSSSAVSLR